VNKPDYEPGSFRDPTARVFYYKDLIYREIFPAGEEKLKFLKEKNLLKDLIDKNFLIGSEELKKKHFDFIDENSIVIKHDKLNFISYPYEWTFNELKDAALFHLDFQIYLLERSAQLVDASAYNVQFRNNKPIFIDLLSIDKYREGEYWVAHKQFCENFLNPLVLTSKKGINFNNWFRGNLEGISTHELSSILNLKDLINPTIFFHVYLLNKIEEKSQKNPNKVTEKIKTSKGLSKNSFRSMLISLKKFIESLNLRKQSSIWDQYSTNNSYSKEDERKKIKAVTGFLKKNNFKLLGDLGCNDGKYSKLATENNVETVIGFDFDLKVLDRAYLNAKKNSLNFFPLYLDASNPSGNLGWNDSERMSFQRRASFDGIFALALTHHLAIAKNIPLNQILSWLVSLAPKGIIEFVPKEDPTTQIMLSLKGDIFPQYNEENFEQQLSKLAKIENISVVSETNRKIYEYKRL